MARGLKLESWLRFLVYVLPLALMFSYYPIITLGKNETMNLELSVPLVWLVVFDILAVCLMAKRRVLFAVFNERGRWLWLLFPAFLTISVIWSLNILRGILVVGILWLIYVAVYGFFNLWDLFNTENFRKKFWRAFFGATILVCLWCVLQCILDLAGVSREGSLMCAGCVYRMFGFSHPNGFAIEPQFMGNLLLAPAIVVIYEIVINDNSVFGGLDACLFGSPAASANNNKSNLKQESSRGRIFHNGSGGSAPKTGFRARAVTVVKNTSGSDSLRFKLLLLFIITATLFLTFSRGAIYAFVVAMVFLLMWVGVQRKSWRGVGKVVSTVVMAFLFTLNVQGIMAAVSPTNDTYQSGVAKVLNHLSLGIIDVREKKVEKDENGQVDEAEMNGDDESGAEAEKNDETKKAEESGTETNEHKKLEAEVDERAWLIKKREENSAVFDGYVEGSTDTRIRLSNAAGEVWAKNPTTVWFGVGIGGAGEALYQNGLSPAPKEIIQNEYMSLLLETGLVGILLFVLTLGLILRVAVKGVKISSAKEIKTAKVKIATTKTTMLKSETAPIVLTMMVAYGITLMFFSGLPNALHIYLLTGLVFVMGLRKKLVS